MKNYPYYGARQHTDTRWRFSIIASFAIVFLLLFNAHSLAQNAETPDKAELFERLQLLSYEERVEAPDFALPNMQEEPLTLSDLQGNVIFLNFWTTW